MLIYHPMLDPYHCALRIASILIDSEREKMEWDRVRLFDFFVAFPHQLENIRLPNEFRSVKRALKKIPLPYENLPGASRLFFQLNELQVPAAGLLAANGFIDGESFVGGQIVLTERKELSSRIGGLMSSLKFRTEDWYRFLVHQLSDYPLLGKNGLKERSGLMEFRHDSV